jgi:hypothetical protein
MADISQGPGWRQASDSKWYPPEQHPDAESISVASGTAGEQAVPGAYDFAAAPYQPAPKG